MAKSRNSGVIRWTIAEARQRFSELIQSAAREPQRLYNRGREVGVLVDPEEFEHFQRWKDAQSAASLADSLAELRQICAEETYVLQVPARRDRVNPFDSSDQAR